MIPDNIMSTTNQDQHYMSKALELARRGLFSTSPNPRVGCVLVKDNQVISEGWHERTGDVHAEAMAIEKATTSLKGVECYVTLEPCNHQGNTPPCTEAIINSGISRVVIAMEDPNPMVAGTGIKKLQQAGLTVETGLMEDEARELNRGFIKRMTTQLPYVVLKMGMSIDARTAMASGESQWISSKKSRSIVQTLRAQSDAVITGRQTVVSDNPSMNVRTDELPLEDQSRLLIQPLRVVLDSKGQLTGSEKVFQLDDEALWVIGEDSYKPHEVINTLETKVVNDKIDLNDLLQQLAAKGCNEVLVEAGAELSGAFVNEDLVDELNLFMAPKLLGDEARGLIKLPGITKLADAKCFHFSAAKAVGPDVQLIFKRDESCSQES